MKTTLLNSQIFLMIEETTSTFNKVGKIATYTTLAIIIFCAIALFIGVATTNNIQFKY